MTVRWDAKPTLRRPVLVCAFSGWNDAADAATDAVRWLTRLTGARPFAALDAITRESLQDELARIHAETGKTIVFVTHSIDEAVYLADEVVAINGHPGRLTATVPIDVPRPRQDRKSTRLNSSH